MQTLRDPVSGCPWDKQQSFSSIVPYTIEEAYELADAIEQGDMAEVQDELGDLLFQVVFYAQMGKEQAVFDFEAVAETICNKLVRRHPHIFADQQSLSSEQVVLNWDAIKQQEREQKDQDNDLSVLANIPTGMEPIQRATKLQHKCAKVGFDWPDAMPVMEKVKEELDEIDQELKRQPQQQDAIEEEIGDLLFAAINLSRHLNVDPQRALRKANNKFEKRFRAVEKHFLDANQLLSDASLVDMEAVWQKIKKT